MWEASWEGPPLDAQRGMGPLRPALQGTGFAGSSDEPGDRFLPRTCRKEPSPATASVLASGAPSRDLSPAHPGLGPNEL